MGPAIYMCICDSSYPRKLAFSYLDELSKEFQRSYGDKIDSAQRPYAFMGFGEFSKSAYALLLSAFVLVTGATESELELQNGARRFQS